MIREIYRERKGEREVRSKLGTATGNFFSSKRDGERYGGGWLRLELVYVFIIPTKNPEQRRAQQLVNNNFQV
jgi:hypothetical protein